MKCSKLWTSKKVRYAEAIRLPLLARRGGRDIKKNIAKLL